MSSRRVRTDLIVKAIAEGFDQVAADMKKIDKSTQSTEKAVKKGNTAWKQFKDVMIGVNQGLEIVKKGIQGAKQVFDFADQGAQIMRLEEASASLARSMDSDMGVIVAALDEASLHTVADTDLMSSASRAMMLGVSADAEQLANLMQVAAMRGRAMGLDTTQAFNDIVTGIGRMSPLILDNLGIVIDAESTYQKYADSIGVAKSELKSTEKRQALLNAVLEDGNDQLKSMGGLTADAATEFEKFKRNIKNATNEIKKGFVPAVDSAIKVVNDMVEAEENLKSDTQKVIDLIYQNSDSFDEYSEAIVKALREYGFFVDVSEEGIKISRIMGQTTRDVTEEFDLFERATFDAAHASEYAAGINKAHAEYLKRVADNANDAAAAQGNLQGALSEVSNALRDHNIAEEKREAIERQLKLLSGEMTEADYEREKAVDTLTDALEGGYITQDEYIAMLQELYAAGQDAAQIIQILGGQINALPEYKKIVIEIETLGNPPSFSEKDTCFIAGTPIDTPEGQRPVEEIQLHDTVYAYDERNKTVVERKVYQLVRGVRDDLVTVTTTRGKYTCSPNHPWLLKIGWTHANMLQAGDEIVTSGGEAQVISVEDYPGHKVVYNFEVKEHHTYFVDGQATHNYEFKASGGPVRAGRSYIVGEEGVEAFVPKEDGYIIPNDKLNIVTADPAAAIPAGQSSQGKLVSADGEMVQVNNYGNITISNPQSGSDFLEQFMEQIE